jgi:hypothetical protein
MIAHMMLKNCLTNKRAPFCTVIISLNSLEVKISALENARKGLMLHISPVDVVVKITTTSENNR